MAPDAGGQLQSSIIMFLQMQRGTDLPPPSTTIARPVARWRVLLVTEDRAVGDRLTDCLQDQCYSTVLTAGADALRHVRSNMYTLVVLDAGPLPSDGFDLLRRIRAQSDVPLILLTRRRHQEADYVLALELGADDVMAGPLRPREMLARARAILRRHELARHWRAGPENGGYRFRGWELRRRTRTLTAPAGRVVDLTRTEYALLLSFLDAPRQRLSRVQLMRATRPGEDIFDRSIDLQVLRLRRKLMDDAGDSNSLIKTERGIGYWLDAAVEPLF